MVKCKLLAFLLCENATKDRDGKVTLQGLFDRIITPGPRALPKLFFVYYKIVVEEPCTVSLRVIYPIHPEIPKDMNWCDSFSQLGPVQSIWALTTSLFPQPGNYALELMQVVEGSEPLSLATMRLVVDEQGV
jgi:hypothetical protein